MLVKILLPHQTVTAADGQPLIAGVNDDRVVRPAPFLHDVEDAANLVIQVRDRGIVVGQVPTHLVGRARKSRKLLVADFQFTVVERMLRHQVLRQHDPGGIVQLHKLRWSQARIVRDRRGQVDEERLCAVMGPEKPDRVVRVFRRGVNVMLAGLDVRMERGVAERARVARLAGMEGFVTCFIQ